MKRSPRLALVVTSDLTASTFLRGYLAHLKLRGWDVTVIASDEGRLDELGTAEGVATASVPMRRDPSPVHDVIAFFRLLWVLVRNRPDVVACATPKASLLGCVASKILFVPIRVYQLWGLRFETEVGRRRRLLITLERITARCATHVLANSRSLARVAESHGIGRDIQVLGNGSSHGIDTSKFAEDALDIPALDEATAEFLSIPTGGPTVVFVGRLNKDKGIDTLLAALDRLEESGIDSRALLVGGQDGREMDTLLSAARSRRRVHLVGAVDDPRPYLLVGDLLCLPTLREGFPNVVLEAAAMSRPAIVSNATGAVDAVVDGVTGIVFPVGDVAALAGSIQELGADHAARKTMGERARRRAAEDFARERVWRLHEDFFRGALASHSGHNDGR